MNGYNAPLFSLGNSLAQGNPYRTSGAPQQQSNFSNNPNRSRTQFSNRGGNSNAYGAPQQQFNFNFDPNRPRTQINNGGGNSNSYGGRGKNIFFNSSVGSSDNQSKRSFSDNSFLYDYAMYPKTDSEDLINAINSRISLDSSNVVKSQTQNQSYLYLRLQANREADERLLNLTGTSLFGDDTLYYFSNIPKDEDKLSTQINEKFSTELLEGTQLDLSNLSDRLGIPPMNKYTVSFVLFLCAIRAFSERCQIKEINFENNGQIDTKGFAHILDLYPDLEKVYFIGNPLGNRNTNIFKPFITPKNSSRPDVELVTKESAKQSSIKTGWGNIAYQKVSNPYQIPLRRVIKGNFISSKRPKLVLGNFIPVSINPNDSPVHRFILAFIDRGWTKLMNINEFYCEDAVFSLTADVCPSNSPLARNFIDNGISRDFLENRLGKIAVGPKEIADAQFSIFGGGFYATIISFDINVINDKICAVVIHGAFHKNADEKEETFSFDRSLLIGSDDENLFITNDHIFVRAPKLPGML